MSRTELTTSRSAMSREELGEESAPSRVRAYAGFTDWAFIIFVHLFIVAFVVVCLLPFWLVLIGSFTKEPTLRLNGFQLFTTDLSLDAYEYVFKGGQVYTSYRVTIFTTVVGTLLSMLVTTPYAYVLASKRAKFSNALSFMTYFTMIFGGGLLGTYILIANWLDLKDKVWALIFPYLLNPFYAFILVAYFRNLPEEIIEAAIIDGANDFGIFWRIAFPLAKPVVASVTLFTALRFWNDWWLSLLFIDSHELHTLQMMIRQLQSAINAAQYINSGQAIITTELVPAYGVRMATVVLTIGPIILAYPFLQRYFVKGMTVGAVKG